MRAISCIEHGTPDTLQLTELPTPEPGPGEVRIAVRACGVNFPDILMIAGRYQIQPELPFTPGAELAGVVDAIGDGVSGVQIGQRVLALSGHGAMAEQVCVAAGRVLPIPDEMNFDIAAGFLLTYSTSWHALKQRAQIQAGETLLVLGAAGGVGLTAVELGNVAGATVIAAASTNEKLQLAKQYGASHGINYSEESLQERVKEITAGKGVDVIYDPVGGELFDQCLRSIAWKGRILVIGFASGLIQKIPANLPLLKGSSVVGVFWGRFAESEPAAQAANIAELLEHFAAGKLRPYVSKVFSLAEASAAFNYLAERKATGKVIVRL
ncbi:MAG: NADPH:quinone oxidoreductase family protein [Woeseia sp.]